MSDGVARSFVFLTAGNVLSPVFSMALVLAISRLRGVEMLGKYSLVMTVFVVGQSCASLGLPVILTREVARARDAAGRYFLNATLVTAAIMGLTLVALLPGTWWLADESEMRTAIAITLLTLLPSAAMGNGEALLLAFGRAGDYVGIALAENLVRAGIGTALVLGGFGVVAIAAALLALRALAVVGLLVVLRRRGVRLGGVDAELCRTLLREIPVVGAIPIVNQLYARSDVFLLTSLGTWREVGLYSAGLRLVDLARTLPAAYGKALYPALARLHGRPAEFAAAARRGMRQVLVLVAPLTFVLGGFAGLLVPAVYGPDAAAGGASLAVLAWSLVPLGLACVLAQVLFAAGRQAVDLRVNVVATVVSVAANALLIPRFGAVGAAMAMVGTTSLYALLQYRWVRAYEVDPDAVDFAARVLAVTGAGVATAISVLGAGPLTAIVLGGTTFAVGVLGAGVVTREDLDQMRGRFAAGGRWLWGSNPS